MISMIYLEYSQPSDAFMVLSKFALFPLKLNLLSLICLVAGVIKSSFPGDHSLGCESCYFLLVLLPSSLSLLQLTKADLLACLPKFDF